MEVNNMAKNKAAETLNDFEESIKNYGSKIEHIDSFVEAVRRFPGKLRHILPGLIEILRNNPLLIAGKSL